MILSLVFPFSSPHIPVTPLPTSCAFTHLFNSPPSQCCTNGPASEAGKPTNGHALNKECSSLPQKLPTANSSSVWGGAVGSLILLYFFLETYKSPSFKKLFLQLFSLGSL